MTPPYRLGISACRTPPPHRHVPAGTADLIGRRPDVLRLFGDGLRRERSRGLGSDVRAQRRGAARLACLGKRRHQLAPDHSNACARPAGAGDPLVSGCRNRWPGRSTRAPTITSRRPLHPALLRARVAGAVDRRKLRADADGEPVKAPAALLRSAGRHPPARRLADDREGYRSPAREDPARGQEAVSRGRGHPLRAHQR